MTSSKGFQHHFNIISKFVFRGCYMKKNAAFVLISFAVLKWHECLSFQLPFELTVEIPVQLHLELEVNLLFHNVIEREIEREKVQMKPPQGQCTVVTDIDIPSYHLYLNNKLSFFSNNNLLFSQKLMGYIKEVISLFLTSYSFFLESLRNTNKRTLNLGWVCYWWFWSFRYW